MFSDRKDYLERLMEQLQELFRALVGTGTKGDAVAAYEKIRETSPSLFGVPYEVLLQFDAATLMRMLNQPVKATALAKVMAAEAEILLSTGDAPTARRRFEHASNLATELTKNGHPMNAELAQALQALGARLSTNGV
jgi:hypothetical protein